MIDLRAADIVLVRSPTTSGVGIRFFTRNWGESPSQVNHTGVIARSKNIIEALARTVRRLFDQAYGPPNKQLVAIYRVRGLPPEQAAIVVAKAESYVGRKYGYLKIVGHALDWFVGGRYLFRRLFQMDNYPMCSWLTEHSYMAISPWLVAHAFCVAGRTFGVPDGSASPDDIWDYVTGHPDKYECVWPLGPWRNT